MPLPLTRPFPGVHSNAQWSPGACNLFQRFVFTLLRCVISIRLYIFISFYVESGVSHHQKSCIPFISSSLPFCFVFHFKAENVEDGVPWLVRSGL